VVAGLVNREYYWDVQLPRDVVDWYRMYRYSVLCCACDCEIEDSCIHSVSHRGIVKPLCLFHSLEISLREQCSEDEDDTFGVERKVSIVKDGTMAWSAASTERLDARVNGHHILKTSS
jgi:hypothetical protein